MAGRERGLRASLREAVDRAAAAEDAAARPAWSKVSPSTRARGLRAARERVAVSGRPVAAAEAVWRGSGTRGPSTVD